MIVKDKIYAEKETNTFKRINEEHPLDIFLGYNERKNPTMVISLEGNLEKVQSSQAIQVDIFNMENSQIRIYFSLLDNSKESIFFKFCEDIIESTYSVSREKVNYFIVSRWNEWRAMFKKATGNLLTENQITGLLGELIFLDKYMLPKYGELKSIEAWNGPNKSHKDFEIEDTWHEIKTIRQAALTIKISSIEQLDSEIDGNLEVIILEKTNSEFNNTINLNKFIEYIGEKIKSFEVYKKFQEKLSQVGYFYDEEYNKYVYRYIKNDTYLVNREFPRVKKEDLQEGIVKVSYDILLKDINKFIKVNK